MDPASRGGAYEGMIIEFRESAMKGTRRIGFVCLLGLALLAGACGPKTSSYVGAWTPKAPDAPREDLVLKEDHTLTLGKPGETPSTGTWSLLEDGRIRLDVRLARLGGVEAPREGSPSGPLAFSWPARLKGGSLAIEIMGNEVLYVRRKP
jgi:hypothetical protein